MTKARILPVGALLVMLGACSDGPSESDAKAAFAREMSSLMSLLGTARNPAAMSATNDIMRTFRLGECAKATGQPGYVCSFSVEVPGLGKQVDQGRFAKFDDGWKYFKR
jgi:hypothetical protein